MTERLPFPYPKDQPDQPPPGRPDEIIQPTSSDLPDEALVPPLDEFGRPISEGDGSVRPIAGDREDRGREQGHEAEGMDETMPLT